MLNGLHASLIPGFEHGVGEAMQGGDPAVENSRGFLGIGEFVEKGERFVLKRGRPGLRQER